MDFLNLDTTSVKETPQGEIITHNDPQLLALKLKASLFATERLGKEHYSPRTEHKEERNINIFQTLDMLDKGLLNQGKVIDINISDDK